MRFAAQQCIRYRWKLTVRLPSHGAELTHWDDNQTQESAWKSPSSCDFGECACDKMSLHDHESEHEEEEEDGANTTHLAGAVDRSFKVFGVSFQDEDSVKDKDGEQDHRRPARQSH